MSNSPLVNHINISPNKTSPRNHVIDTITIHCVVGQLSVETLGNVFKSPSRQASSNYGVGSDGRIGMYVEEKDRSWCSSNRANDNRAVTIEVACDPSEPYAVNDKAYNALIQLVADICKRNNIKKLLWKNDKSLIGQVDKQNMTVHRWFANTQCPATFLMNHHADIADKVNQILGASEVPSQSNTQGDKAPEKETPAGYPATPFLVNVLIPNLNIRSAPSLSASVKGVTKKGTFTIVEVRNGWGRLKSGRGWIYLENPSYCKIQ